MQDPTRQSEAWVATFKTELVDGRRFPSYEHAEHETLNWIGFYNGERLHEELDDLPPAEYEELNFKTDDIRILSTSKRASRKPRALHTSPPGAEAGKLVAEEVEVTT